jgi:hypothetical protein
MTKQKPAADLVRHMPWASGVYMIRHRQTGERYIGSSRSIRQRVYEHVLCWRNGRCGHPGICRVLNSHGEDFEFSVIALCPVARLHKTESRFIQKLKPELNVRDPVSGRRLDSPSRPSKGFVQHTVLIPGDCKDERDAFDHWCRYGGSKMSMSLRIRQLMMADAAGQIDLPRTSPPMSKPKPKR